MIGRRGSRRFKLRKATFAAEARHEHIQQHSRGRVMGCVFKRSAPSLAFRHLKPGVRKDISDGPPHIAVIIYDEYFGF